MDAHGDLYGTTYYGGGSGNCSGGCGTVFAISTTRQGAIQIIVNQVNGLLAQGVIDRQQDNSLVQDLHLATGMIKAGRIGDAITNLTSFTNQVTDLINSNVLTSDQASLLINAASYVMAQIQ